MVPGMTVVVDIYLDVSLVSQDDSPENNAEKNPIEKVAKSAFFHAFYNSYKLLILLCLL